MFVAMHPPMVWTGVSRMKQHSRVSVPRPGNLGDPRQAISDDMLTDLSWVE